MIKYCKSLFFSTVTSSIFLLTSVVKEVIALAFASSAAFARVASALIFSLTSSILTAFAFSALLARAVSSSIKCLTSSISCASLSEREIDDWENEHIKMLEQIAPEKFSVKHYGALAELKRKQ